MSHLIQIGNSHGVRIPKTIIQQLGLMDVELELKVVPEGLLIVPLRQTRKGWADSFQTAALAEQMPLIPANFNNKFDDEEWEW